MTKASKTYFAKCSQICDQSFTQNIDDYRIISMTTEQIPSTEEEG